VIGVGLHVAVLLALRDRLEIESDPQLEHPCGLRKRLVVAGPVRAVEARTDPEVAVDLLLPHQLLDVGARRLRDVPCRFGRRRAMLSSDARERSPHLRRDLAAVARARTVTDLARLADEDAPTLAGERQCGGKSGEPRSDDQHIDGGRQRAATRLRRRALPPVGRVDDSSRLHGRGAIRQAFAPGVWIRGRHATALRGLGNCIRRVRCSTIGRSIRG